MDRFFEISKNELENANGMNFLWLSLYRFREQVEDSFLGNNIIILYANDFNNLKKKAELYDRLSTNSDDKK